MSNWIEQDGRKYYPEPYLRGVMETAKRRGQRIAALEAEVARLREENRLLIQQKAMDDPERRGWEEAERAVIEAPITWIPALFIKIVKRSKKAWSSKEAMLNMAGKAWDQE